MPTIDDTATRTSRLPGLAVVGLLVAAAYALGTGIASAGPLLWATGLGVAAAPLVRSSAAAASGLDCARTTVLRIGVALLGLQISFGDIASIGATGVCIAGATLTTTLLATLWFGRRLGLASPLTLLLAVGTAICGASAIAAVSSVARMPGAAVGYSIAAVTVFGTLSMFAVPLLAAAVDLSEYHAGLWAGAAVHEVAQATGAGGMISSEALATATVTKLMRVAMLAPVIVLVALLGGSHSARVAPLPGFLVAFVVLVGIRSVAPLPATCVEAAAVVSGVLLAAGLVALGTGVAPGALRRAGIRPLAVAAIASVVALVTALSAIVAAG